MALESNIRNLEADTYWTRKLRVSKESDNPNAT